MTGLPIYDRVMDDIADLFHPRHYHDPSSPASTPEEPVDLATIEQDARNVLQNVITHGEQLAADAKNVLETHLPKIVGEAAKVQGSLIMQTLEGFVMTPAQEQVIAEIIGKAVSLFPEPTPAEAVPAAEPAEAVPADMAMGQPAGPSVAGVA